MKRASDSLEFEKAIEIREKINQLKQLKPQKKNVHKNVTSKNPNGKRKK